MAQTVRGSTGGQSSSRATYMRLLNSTSFQKVFQTVLYFVLESVDCGVAMSDAVNGEPCGHIIVSYRFHAVRHKIPGHRLSLLVIVCLLQMGMQQRESPRVLRIRWNLTIALRLF